MARAKSASTKGAGTVTKKTADKAKAKGGSTTKAKSASSAPRGKAAPAKKAAAKKAAPAKRSAPAKASAKAAEKKAPAKKAPAKAAEKAPAKAAKAAKAAEKAPEKRAPEKKAAAPKRPEAVPAKTPPAAKRPIPAKRNKPAPAEAKPVVQVSSARPSIPPPEDDPKFDNVPPLPEGLRVHPDSELGEKQAAYLYAALLAERERVTQGMGRHIAAAIGEGQPMAEEMDMAQRHAEQAYLMRFADKERKLLREIDHALAKFREGEYGICEGTGEPISYRRLELRPWTRYSVEFKEQIEREKRQHR